MREMRRKDRQLTEEEAMDVVRKGEYGVLATVGDDGKPYSVPLSYVLDEEKGALYFHGTAAGGQKMDNILANPSVCFTVVMDTEVLPAQFSTKYYSANVFGTAKVVEEEEEKKKALLLLVRKYAPDYEEQGRAYIERAIGAVAVVRLDVEQVTGKARKK
ncbi:pyridoxamine 5'-phosphate oxidase family protein [uncultured Dialister sp.]|jgi:nitroimidazol reductase NimA-like FMN-containing flavoprotein (pyridoxamine 5'-phosphate oxidase superfamily)|uniref:pyridoxamine 5'-phosphate oxidase family protein n=1 Tax=uncultured Dialister sp. TaxID=278064 RepID=UPI00265E520D|nr:pyridoxamine 5'-phosphate oxidase family protein [uncultured Dialister sp.]